MRRARHARRDRSGPARHRDEASAYHLAHPVGPKHLDQAVNLILSPRRFDHERLGADVDHARAVDVHELHDLRARIARGRDLDQRQVARDRRPDAQVLHAPDRHELIEIGLETPRAVFVGVDDDRHAREPGLLRMADRQRFNIERAAAEQRRHAVQNTGLVVDIDSECMGHAHTYQPRRHDLRAFVVASVF